jgi:D-sedoheptulose 7-phosphate isomerase
MVSNSFPTKKYKSADKFFLDYSFRLNEVLNNINSDEIIKAAKLVEKIIRKNNSIFVCGNGGSMAVANHMLCDFSKAVSENTKIYPKVFSLVSNHELISAISNDISFDEILTRQARNIITDKDIVILISSSGNSKNLINLINFCSKKKISTLAIVGFDGGYLKKYSRNYIHIPINNYGIAEDCSQIIMHVITQYLKQKFLKLKNINKIIF